MKHEHVVLMLFILGLVLTVIFKDYSFFAIPSLGIPALLTYIGRRENILSKSPLFDLDTLLILGIAVCAVLLFEIFTDPRIGLLIMGLLAPIFMTIRG
ncbi:hypothetical protein [Pyrococcus abyssi]|uniref:Uncharacterized protein n=1 Tax=Pyrococcus abyssi (strain GE5 / Orsay) TaxID=272844 RepID=G8ZH50_PYRAB|nr:hypothetical protein [Pyrococcus abyssi]CCE70245.1 TPA: hypothetical protein PAB0564.1n [Pyrococcus abyssi GE5]